MGAARDHGIPRVTFQIVVVDRRQVSGHVRCGYAAGRWAESHPHETPKSLQFDEQRLPPWYGRGGDREQGVGRRQDRGVDVARHFAAKHELDRQEAMDDEAKRHD